MLLDMPIVCSTLDALEKEFQEFDLTDLYRFYLETFNSVDEWKFSDGDYFDYFPHDAERMGFSSPRLMKKKYASVEEACELGKYCSGFSGGNHVITISPRQRGIQAIQARLYEHDSGFLKVYSVDFKGVDQPEKMKSKLSSLGTFLQLDDGAMLYVGCAIGGNFSVFYYSYSSSGKVLSGRAIAKGWPGEGEWFYHYGSEGGLSEITSGDASLWKKK